MKITEINISPAFISACAILFLTCGLMGIKGDTIFWMILCIFGIMGFIILDLCQMILSKELFKKKEENI